MSEATSRITLVRWLTIAALLLCMAGVGRAAEDAKPDRPGNRERPERQRAQQDRPRQEGPQQERPQRDGQGGPAGQIRERLEQAIDQLGLTPEQREQLKPIREEIRTALQGLRSQIEDLSPQDRRQRVQEALGEVRGKVEQILTDEQKTKLRETLQSLRPGPGQGKRAPNAAPVPSTGPSNENASPAEQGRGAMLERIRGNLEKLDLNPDQKKKVDDILADASEQLIKLRKEAEGDLGSLREKARDVFVKVREQVGAVLTPEQREKMRDLMPAGARRTEGPPPAAEPAAPDPTKARAANPPAKPAQKPAEAAMGDSDTMMSAKPAPSADMQSTSASNTNVAPVKPEASSSPARAAAKVSLQPGQAAPAFRLSRLDGRPATLGNFTGKPLVLVFGSYTSPTFRDKVATFEAMKKNYRNKANIVVVYTREAYPANEWDVQRNIDDQIAVNQHATLDERIKLAKDTRDGLKITLDILVDDIDDGIAAAYDGLPNGAVVIDAQGKILGRQKWADPYGLSLLVDEALKTK